MLELVRCREAGEEPDVPKEGGEEYETEMVQLAIIKIKKLMETIFGSLGN